MASSGSEFRAYLKAICGDQTFQARRQSYVPTDLLDRQRQKHSQPTEQPDFFAEFAAFDLNLNVQTAREEKSKPEDEPRKSEKIERLPVLQGIRQYAAEHVLLLGRPGSGKSTALERLLLQEAELAQVNAQVPIPVLLKLRDVRSSVWDLLRSRLVSRDLALETLDLNSWLTSGRLLLLWDGVNELPSDEALKELKELRQRYSQTPMIFTTRTLSVGSDLGIEKKLEMQPLSEPQMRQFTCTYLGEEKGNRLISRLGQRLREFGETPLLLWMLCGVYAKAGQIPSNLGSVFRRFAEIYDDKKEFDQKARLWQSRFLQTLAFAMMPQGDSKGLRLSLLKSEAVELFAQVLEKETDPLTRAIGYLDNLLRHHLLQSKNHSEIEFHHQLFQEYFAAEYLLRQLDQLDDLTLQKLYLNSLDWTESLALMLGIFENERQALRVVRLALEVDLKLGARLAGEVKEKFQKTTVGWVIELEVPEWLKVELLGSTRSNFAVSRLAQALCHKNYYVRNIAAEALGKINSQQAVEALILSLNHEDSSVRRGAARALGKIGSEQAVAVLIQVLNDEDSDVRSSAAEALGKIGSEQAVAVLIQALNDEDSFVRRRAAEALGKIGSKQAAKTLIQVLNHEDSYVRSSAAEALGAIGSEQATEALIQVLNHEDSSVQWIAAEALGRIGSEQATEALIQVLNDEDSELRSSAAEALGEIGSKQAAKALIQALNDENSFVRSSAARALGKTGSEQAVAVLIQVLNHEDSELRSSVAEALGKIGSKQAVAVLIQVLNNAYYYVRSSAAEALGKIGSKQAVAVLIQALNDEDSDVRRNAAEALGRIGSEQAVTALIQVLNNAYYSVRRNAAEALGKIGSEQAVTALIQALNHEGHSVRRNAAEALGKIGSEQAVTALIQALNDKYYYVQSSAAEALGKIGSEQAVTALIQVLNHEDSSVRSSAAEALGKIAAPQLLVQLWQLCRLGNREAFNTISPIQERCRFYNYEIEQMTLPTGSATDQAGSVTNIHISGGNFGDVVARDKTIQVKRDYVENQENSIEPPLA